MARDLETARNIVQCVMRPVMGTWVGHAEGPAGELEEALETATEDVADLLDRDETYDVDVDPAPQVDVCMNCGTRWTILGAPGGVCPECNDPKG